MSKGVNKVILVGHVGKDPEISYTASGLACARVSIATSESWKDKHTGEKQERTEWHRVVFFGKLAEVVGEWVKKGALLYVEGSLRTNKYQDKVSGQDRYSTDINANVLQMLGSKGTENLSPKEKSHETQNNAPIDDMEFQDIPF